MHLVICFIILAKFVFAKQSAILYFKSEKQALM